MKSLACTLLAMSSLIVASESHAIILHGEDNSANQTDPGNGAPWNYVAHLGNLSGTGVGSSAVYLGWGWMLTADHVAQRSSVSFDGGVTSLAVDASSWQQVAEDVDLKVFRLSDDPELAPLMLYEDAQESADLNQGSTLVGWGVGRDPNESDPGDDVVPWGDNSTREKRWGFNDTDASTTTFELDGRSTDALRTFLDNDAGPNQAAATMHDSGGAMFQELNGEWYLSGISIGVSQGDQSTFGTAGIGGGPLAHSGDENYFARMATYSDDINAIIPEPSTWAFVLGLGALSVSVCLRRRS